jgi:hypothetical protein
MTICTHELPGGMPLAVFRFGEAISFMDLLELEKPVSLSLWLVSSVLISTSSVFKI